jgi:hypothetical protein
MTRLRAIASAPIAPIGLIEDLDDMQVEDG